MSQGKLGAQDKTEYDGLPRQSDPAFKLFGRTIPVVPAGDEKTESKGEKQTDVSVITSATDSFSISSIQDAREEVPHFPDGTLHSEGEGDADCDLDELGSSSGSNNGHNEEKSSQGNSKVLEKSGISALIHVETDETDEEAHEDNQGLSSQEKTPKRPDKPVPCPRCDSLDTKFCYYNNYNVNQPRHFCKNCQRYWTAGGTLRNVPVGAGRRKNKNSASHQRHVLPDCLSMRNDTPDAAQQLHSCSVAPGGTLNTQLQLPPSASRLHLLPLDMCSLAALDSPSSSTILSFGPESPLCENMAATSLNLQPKHTLQSQGIVSERVFNAMDVDSCSSWQMESPDIKSFYEQEQQVQNGICSANDLSLKVESSFGCQHIDESRCGSSVTDHALNQQQVGIGECRSGSFSCWEPPPATILGSTNVAPFSVFGGPWHYGHNIGCNSAPAFSSSVADSALSSAQTLGHAPPNSTWGGLPGNLWSGVPWPFMQSPMWGPAGWGGAWNMPWGPSAAAAAAAVTATANPGLVSPRLRKHPREHSQLDGGTEGSLWVPKTLRIDDPGEAARSSIWSALGLENKPESITSGGIFKAFQPKAGRKDNQESPMQPQHTNPAAMFRSMSFQERE